MKAKRVMNVAVFLLAVAMLPAQSGTEQNVDQLSSREALTMVRAINTIELSYRSSEGEYVPLEVLLLHPKFDDMGIAPTITDPYTVAIKDYKLSIVTFAEGEQYKLSLVPTGEPYCRLALFSDQIGVIYPGKGLGCPEE